MRFPRHRSLAVFGRGSLWYVSVYSESALIALSRRGHCCSRRRSVQLTRRRCGLDPVSLWSDLRELPSSRLIGIHAGDPSWSLSLVALGMFCCMLDEAKQPLLGKHAQLKLLFARKIVCVVGRIGAVVGRGAETGVHEERTGLFPTPSKRENECRGELGPTRGSRSRGRARAVAPGAIGPARARESVAERRGLRVCSTGERSGSIFPFRRHARTPARDHP